MCVNKNGVHLHMVQWILSVVLLFNAAPVSLGWGFTAHKQINRHAVFILPPAMFTFYKRHLHFITENAINPDKRRYVLVQEAPRHYIDMEYYDALSPIPERWSRAVKLYGEQVLMKHGILPWHIAHMKYVLTEAFRQKDVCRILRLSADIGHYIADANVPLHTSQNYDGQLTEQDGIHGLWESRLPELFLDGYDFFVGQATYVKDPQACAWKAIRAAHQTVKLVLKLEKELSATFPAMQKYSFEQRGRTLKKVYSEAYSRAYHELLAGLVEQQMRASIKMVGDFWLTCWEDAGQPDLNALLDIPLHKAQLIENIPKKKLLKVRVCCEE